MSASDFQPLEEILGHEFSDQALLAQALTHSSTGAANYERLEFLGDRVLGLVVAQTLYERFPDEAEGDLAKRLAALVQGSLLAQVAAEAGLGDFVNLSESERAAGGAENDNILADVFEALIGALYLDAGFGKCEALIRRLWVGRFDKMSAPPLHPKTALQEWAQSQGLPLPEYTIESQSGPDHAPVFKIRVHVEGYKDARAQGKSRQVAEKDAAKKFLETNGLL